MNFFAKERMTGAVDIYMTEIGQYPLLSARKEVKLAIRYERGRAAKHQLESFAIDDQMRIELERVVRHGQQARQQLIHCNLRLVIALIRQYAGCGVPFGDLVQEGNVGLIQAVERYDHRRGVRFASYAGWWIRQAVLRAIACQSRPIRLPCAVNDELGRMHRASAQLETCLQRLPTIDELAAEMGVSTQRVRQLQVWDRQIVSLDVPVGENDDRSLADMVPDRDAPTVDERLARRQLVERLQEVIDSLNSRDRTLLRLRFGLDGDPRQTLRQVAGTLGITQERVRQVEKAALKRLRRTRALHELRSI